VACGYDPCRVRGCGVTRVILTNKKTGQTLPEAELVRNEDETFVIQFDASTTSNAFDAGDWDAKIVREFRNGDVIRRVDRSRRYVVYIYFNGTWYEIDDDGPKALPHGVNPSAELFDNPDWELV
jgi:hypothetical protein